jgi:hypothetical protein
MQPKKETAKTKGRFQVNVPTSNSKWTIDKEWQR